MIAAAGGSCNFNFPDGLNGVAITSSVSTSNPCKFLIIKNYTYWADGSPPHINGIHYNSNNFPIILNSGDILTNDELVLLNKCPNSSLLISDNTNSNAITSSVSTWNPYQVPNNKKLYILSWNGSSH